MSRFFPSTLRAIIVLPAIGAAIALLGRMYMEGQWATAWNAQVGSPGPTLATVCSGVLGADASCQIYGALGWMTILSLATFLLALLAVGGIALAASQAGRDPAALVRLFQPVLFLSITAAIFLAFMDGAIVILAAWYGVAAFSGYSYPFAVLVAGAAVAVATWGMAGAAVRSIRSSNAVVGEPVTRSDEPALWALVDRVALALGMEPPDNLVLGLSPEIFATMSPISTNSGTLTGQTLYLSLPICRIVDQAELAAIVGHELGHFKGGDLETTRRFYPIYARASRSLGAVTGVSRSSTFARLTLMSAYETLRFFLMSFAIAERSLSRDRELAADRIGASVTAPAAMGSALTKLTALTPMCSQLVSSATNPGVDALAGDSVGAQMFHTLQVAPVRLHLPALDSLRLPHPTDTHPPLSVRLAALGVSLAQLKLDSEPATSLIPDSSAREVRLIEQSKRGRTAPGARLQVRLAEQSADSDWTRDKVLKAVEFVRAQRGGRLAWILLPREDWVAIDDLLLEPQTTEPFQPLVARDGVSTEAQWVVSDLADPKSVDGAVLKAGTKLALVGKKNPGTAASTLEGIVFTPLYGSFANKLVLVHTVGHGTVHQGLAGACVVPTVDNLSQAKSAQNDLIGLIEDALDDLDGPETDGVQTEATVSLPS